MSNKKENLMNQQNEATVKLSKYQNFEFMRVHRSQIKEAAYNPRIISEYGEKLLRKTLKNKGLVEALVWNKRTGNLVGGHQRLHNIDALEKTKDYFLDVCAVDVDEKTEKELNIILNNPNMQGQYDGIKLADLFIDGGASFVESGFNQADLEIMFDTPELNKILGSDKEVDEVVTDIETLNEMKSKHKEAKKKLQEADTDDYFRVVVFNNVHDMQAFCDFFDLNNGTRYVDGYKIAQKAGLRLSDDAADVKSHVEAD